MLNQLFGSQEKHLLAGWKSLEEESQIEEILERSNEKPVLVFKHSPSCGISAMVKHQLERNWDFKEEELEVYYLDVIHHRPTSMALASRLGVVHQSPQVLLIYNGKSIFDTSHHMISVGVLHEAIQTILNA
ncbi:MAG: bacillithiol system redox-active protein YtxJ [Bacteroidota bacterium]